MGKASRRDFLKGAVALGLGGVAVQCRRAPEVLKVIDVHVHANFQDEVLRSQAQKVGRVEFSPEGLKAEMAGNHVEQAISIGFETAQGELSHEAANPMGVAPALDSVFAVGGINPHRLDGEGLARIDQALAGGKLKGLKIYLGYYHKGPDDDVYKPVYELAGKHRVPVILHTGDTYSKNAKVRYAHPLPIDDVAVDFRQVNFVVAHVGNPWTMDAAELLYKNPNVYGDLSGFLVGDEAYFNDPKNAEGFEHVLERIRRAFAWVENPRKFLYGSDWPLAPMRPYMELMRRAIEPEHHERVFYSNAREVFGL